MPPTDSESADKRIPLTPSVFDEIRDFSRGLDTTYSEAITFLLSLAIKPGEDTHMAGRRLRKEFKKASK